MSLADEIITAITDSKPLNFEILRKKLKGNKNLSKQDFKTLIKVLETRALEILAIDDLTINECKIIGKALMASKLEDINKIIRFIIKRSDKRTSLFLYDLLNKRCKIDCAPVQQYIHYLITQEMHLSHYKVLLVISKNYPFLITSEILNFCKDDNHPISKEIIARHETKI